MSKPVLCMVSMALRHAKRARESLIFNPSDASHLAEFYGKMNRLVPFIYMYSSQCWERYFKKSN